MNTKKCATCEHNKEGWCRARGARTGYPITEPLHHTCMEWTERDNSDTRETPQEYKWTITEHQDETLTGYDRTAPSFSLACQRASCLAKETMKAKGTHAMDIDNTGFMHVGEGRWELHDKDGLLAAVWPCSVAKKKKK